MSKSYTCPLCFREHAFALWAIAHWHIKLKHTCKCGAINTLLRGEVVKTKKPKNKVERIQ